MPTLIVLIGPTGVGKTELSLRLAENISDKHCICRFETALCRIKNRHGSSYSRST